MLTIKFKTKQYKLPEMPSVEAIRFQCYVDRGSSTVDEVVEEATGATEIYIYEDGEVIGVYKGYERPIAFTLIDGRFSIELANTDIYKAIDALNSRVDNSEAAIESMHTEVSNLNGSVGSLNSEVNNLNETQMSQDAAIEDLASAL